MERTKELAERPYPRVCAHRGIHSGIPENSMPAFLAAVAAGAEEIELDLWYTKDAEIVSIHDATLERVSDGTGLVYEHTKEELQQFDFGAKCGEAYAGLRILTFEDILRELAGRIAMNIHVKTVTTDCPYDRAVMEKMAALIRKYHCEDSVYFNAENDRVLRLAQEVAPEIGRCCDGGDEPWRVIERALETGCTRVQLCKPDFDRALIRRAHENGIRCNVYWSDDAAETAAFLDMGIDTILTNCYEAVAPVVKSRQAK